MQRITTPLFPESGPSRDPTRPSIFDLLAQDQLRELFHPVVRYVLSYFAQRYPRYLLRILNHHEEFFAILLLILERHHLKKHNASISEHFYGLRSTPISSLKTPRLDTFSPPRRKGMTRKQRWGLLVFLVGLPYVRARAQDYFESLGGGRQSDEIGEEDIGRAVTKSEKVFKLLYPYLSLGIDLTFLGYDMAFLFEKTDYPRPWHKWLGLSVIRRGAEDEPESSGLLSKLPPLLPPLLLLLKLSQWWYSPSSPRSHPSLTANENSIAATHAAILPPRPLPILPGSIGSLPLTPPLTPPEEVDQPPLENPQIAGGEQVEKKGRYKVTKESYGDCPLCGKKWQNPAVLPSGWVVCWRCGWDAIEGEDGDEEVDEEGREKAEMEEADAPVQIGNKRRKGRCPITGVEVGPGDLRRVLI
ncbi:hypothetical protein I302_109137 [Kwoniella bestiolae CBS 10118]|uniref:Peroxisome assembly protein 12 n=1 Tax=Kwoniella bestiolae CBS 10118 TaxID=1296100 RepID=A0A1B9FV39_9TREE|nr:hypothetical protein I302_08283 [Kwoniella bestiolae CBS 10118]OCF22632.1 hypothetical protein I302_08283 [Kwoniella bestiolae CBS 10118]